MPGSLEIDFSQEGAYAEYNWDIFFHMPLLLAVRLSTQGHFDVADRWFRYIIDLRDNSDHPAPQKYWKTRPFFNLAQSRSESVTDLLRGLAAGGEESEIRVWRDDPFNPHAIARQRLRAYMKCVAFKYLDHLIAWLNANGTGRSKRRDRLARLRHPRFPVGCFLLEGPLSGRSPALVRARSKPTAADSVDVRHGRELRTPAVH